MERGFHTAWTPPSLPDSIVLLGGDSNATRLTAETVPGVKIRGNILLHLHIYTGGGSFDLKRSAYAGSISAAFKIAACGIPDGGDNSIVLIGGGNYYITHNYVTRWVDAKIIIMWTMIVMMIMILTMIMKMNILALMIKIVTVCIDEDVDHEHHCYDTVRGAHT